MNCITVAYSRGQCVLNNHGYCFTLDTFTGYMQTRQGHLRIQVYQAILRDGTNKTDENTNLTQYADKWHIQIIVMMIYLCVNFLFKALCY